MDCEIVELSKTAATPFFDQDLRGARSNYTVRSIRIDSALGRHAWKALVHGLRENGGCAKGRLNKVEKTQL